MTATPVRSRSRRAKASAAGEQLLPGAVGRQGGGVEHRELRGRLDPVGGGDRRGAVRLVDRDVGQEGQQLAAGVARRGGRQQPRVGLDERRGDRPAGEVGVASTASRKAMLVETPLI